MNDDKSAGFHVGNDINIDYEMKMSEYGLLLFSFFIFNAITLSLEDDNGQDVKIQTTGLILVLTTPFSLVE